MIYLNAQYLIQGFDTFSLWMLVAATLVSISCALLGNYLVLRRMSMMGDAITHAVLPGLALGFMISQSRDLWVMLLGAIIAGLLTTVFTQWVGRFGKVDRGAAMGVVFTSLFALGLVLMQRYAHNVDLDADCVLYGALEAVPTYTWVIFGMDIPRAVITGGLMLVMNMVFILVCYKELKISAFDPALATTIGLSSNIMHYALMTLVAITTVTAFEVVGSILVVAMLIAPAATAYLLTNRLNVMIGLSVLFAAMASLSGHISAINFPKPLVDTFNFKLTQISALLTSLFGEGFAMQGFGYDQSEPLETTIAGMIAVTTGVIFMVAFILSPKRGLVVSWWRKKQLQKRILLEDVLGLLYRLEEDQPGKPHGEQVSVICQGGRILPKACRAALKKLNARGKVYEEARRWRLSESGREDAAKLIRAHRLWEAYLQSHLNLPDSQLHNTAEKLEHLTNIDLAARLAEGMGKPGSDPHGRRIP